MMRFLLILPWLCVSVSCGYGQDAAVLLKKAKAAKNADTQIELLTKAIAAKPELEAAYLDRGRAYYRKGRFDEAVSDFSRVINRDSKNTDAYMWRAMAYDSLGIREEALADYTRAIAINPANGVFSSRRGQIHKKLGNYEKAAGDFGRAIGLDLKDPIARNNRAYCYMKLGKWPQAKTDLTRAIALEKSFPSAYLNLAGYWWTARNNRKMAIKYLELAFKTGFKNYDGLYDPAAEGEFIKGLPETPEFKALYFKYYKKKKK